MKAWEVKNKDDDDDFTEIVFADNNHDARAKSNLDGSYMDLEAHRAPYVDNTENISDFEFKILMMKNGWTYVLDRKVYDEDNISEFIEEFGNERS